VLELTGHGHHHEERSPQEHGDKRRTEPAHAGVDAEMSARGERLHCDQGRQQRHGQHVADVTDAGVAEHPARHGKAGKLERVAAGRAG